MAKNLYGNECLKNYKRMKLKTTAYIAMTMIIMTACSANNDEHDASGSFEATEIIISSEANGKIEYLSIEEGQKLEENQHVGLIDTTQLYLQKMNLFSNSEGVQNSSLRNQIVSLEREKEQALKTLKENETSSKKLEGINKAIEKLQKQLAEDLSKLQKKSENISNQSSSLEIQMAQIEYGLKKSNIISPIAGTVLTKYAQAGELANMGKPLFKVADINDMTLRLYVTNDQLATLKLNDTIQIFVDQSKNNKKTYNGVITWISDKSEFTPKTIQTKNERANLVYAIKVSVKNDGYLKIGMYGQVKFESQ